MITNVGLNQLANYFKGRVATVVLNGDIRLQDFHLEEVNENVYTLEFDIPSGISQLSNLMILDSDDETVAINNLFVPVEGDVRFKYMVTLRNAR